MNFIFIRLNVLREVPLNFSMLLFHGNSCSCVEYVLQYLERELRMEGLPFPYDFEVCFSAVIV